MGELFPTEIRATACGSVMAMGKAAAVVNYKLFPMALASFGFHQVLYFYAFITAFMAAWGFFTIKDTDHLSLTQIQDMLKNSELQQEERRSLLCESYSKYDSLSLLKNSELQQEEKMSLLYESYSQHNSLSYSHYNK